MPYGAPANSACNTPPPRAKNGRRANHQPQPPHVVITSHHIGVHCRPVTSHDHSIRSPSARPAADNTDVPQYEIRVKGHLGPRWAAWFDGLSLTTEEDGTTVLSGPVVDQAALHGLLHKLRDVGIPLVSLIQLPTDAPTDPTVAPPAPETPEGN
jgi:hypothetical protein